MAQTTSLFFQDEVLPGVLTEIHSDYSYNSGYYTTTWGTTASVLIIGTAFSGPTNKVMKIYSPEHAMYVYGSTYDAKTHQEASLVTGIQDAYDKGCRAIYACRVSGKDMYKDFAIIPNLGYRFRVAGKYPSNSNKDVYCRFINSNGELKFVYYKPADRATIYEKMQGIVESDNSMIETVLDLSGTFGFTKESRIQDVFETINTYSLNNVLHLSMVDEAGEDITNEATSLPIEALFEGVYFIGRNANNCTPVTLASSKQASSDPFWKAYSFIGTIVTLGLNTNVCAEYPISGKYDDLCKILTNVSHSELFDFIADSASIDALFAKDNIDYEEVDLTGFELYKKLGSGFATTAHIELKDPTKDLSTATAKDFVVKETPVSNANRIAAVNGGTYSFLQNVPSDYRVLTCGTASTDVTAKLPHKNSFLKKSAGNSVVLTANGINAIRVTPKVTDGAIFDSDTTYTFSVATIAENISLSQNDVDSLKHIDGVISCSADKIATLEDGTLFIIDGTLCVKNGDAYTSIHELGLSSMFDGKQLVNMNTVEVLTCSSNEDGLTCTTSEFADDYAVVSYKGNTYLLKKSDDGLSLTGTIAQVVSDDNSGLYTVLGLNYSGENKIMVSDEYMTSTTYATFIEDLNSSVLGKYFLFSLADKDFEVYANSYLDQEDVALSPQTVGDDTTKFMKMVYDTTKYIPYTTSDNLARQLAQHCTYTSLKTSPTHGMINYARIGNTGLTAIANAVTAACEAPFMSDLYAKKENGRNMLNKDNMPYDIGKNISVTFGPGYYVTAPDGYQYVSNGAAGYAGMVSALKIEQAPTSQPIDISNLIFELSNYQITKLTNAGYVTFKNSYTKGVVVTDGITAALATSEFRRLSATRIMNAVDVLIRAACEPFIGQQNSLPNRNSIKTAINSSLKKVVNVLIQDYDFVISSDAEQQKIGKLDIDYVVVPFYEIRQIRNRVAVRDSLN